jgi:hypothetical protein
MEERNYLRVAEQKSTDKNAERDFINKEIKKGITPL